MANHYRTKQGKEDKHHLALEKIIVGKIMGKRLIVRGTVEHDKTKGYE